MSAFPEDEPSDSDLKQSCVKLFVGQIPREMDEDTLIPYFSEFGPIVELTVIRDRLTKAHKGCAFVTYLEMESAFRAIEQLHDKIKLGNAVNPLQVRIAECQVERENKLFIGMLPKTVDEEQLHDMFVKFGDLREVHIIRGPEGSSKGCAFVKYVDRDAAMIAIQEMHNRIPEGSTRPLVVKFADVKRHGKKVDSEEALAEKMNGMSIRDGNYWGAQQSQQPYVVSYGYGVPGQPVVSMPMMQYAGASPSNSNGSPNYMFMNSVDGYNGQDGFQRDPLIEGAGVDRDGSDNDASRPPEGPSGANLFIYHLPRDLTDADLATLFAPFGNVISAKVFVDKKTSDSKGFGFVSFDSIESANSAINAMNGFQIGSKRLKVQHKRTHDPSSSGPVGSMNQSVPMQSLHIQPPLQLLSQPATLHAYMPTYIHPGQTPNMGSNMSSNMGSMRVSAPAGAVSQPSLYSSNTGMYRMNNGVGMPYGATHVPQGAGGYPGLMSTSTMGNGLANEGMDSGLHLFAPKGY